MVVLYLGAVISLLLTLFFKLRSGWKFKFDFYSVSLIVLVKIPAAMITIELKKNPDVLLSGDPIPDTAGDDAELGTLSWRSSPTLSVADQILDFGEITLQPE